MPGGHDDGQPRCRADAKAGVWRCSRGVLYRPATVMIGERFGESTLRQYQFFSKTYPDVRQNSETSENLGEIMRHKAFFYGNFPSMTIEESKLSEITNILIVKPMNQVWRSA